MDTSGFLKSGSAAPHWRELTPRGPVLRPRYAAKYVGLSRSGMYAKIKAGEFPSLIRLGERTSGIPQNWLDAFIAECANEKAGAK
jgi:predicted DNA-binding transcriptional regulator AlpA